MSRTALLITIFGMFAAAASILTGRSRHQLEVLKRAGQLRTSRLSSADLESPELARPFSERVLSPLLQKISGMVAQMMPGRMINGMRAKIMEAGRPLSVERLIGVKLLVSLVTLAVYAGIIVPRTDASRKPLTVVLAVLASLLAFNTPDMWLSGKSDERKSHVRRWLPDVLDLLTVSVEAGLGFDAAIQKVSEKFKEPVAGEFRLYLAEVRLGKGRREALRNLARRNNIPEMQAFAASMVQADQLGVSISQVLRSQSESLRVRRKQTAEEKAQQAPVKMLFPLILFIFPTLFFVLLGPVVVRWSTTISGFGR